MQNLPGVYDPYADVRELSAEVSFELIDVDADISVTPTASEGTFFSQLEQTHDRITTLSKRYATLETNYWQLTGGFSLINENGQNDEIGYWSNAISDINGNIDISMTFVFDTIQSSRAFTVIFDNRTNNYATDFELTAYDSSDAVLGNVHVTDNTSYIHIVDLAAMDYKKLIIQFNKTSLPFRRIRIAEVVFGFLQTFDDDNIKTMTIKNQTTLDSSSQPSNSLSLTINNIERNYNIINPSGFYFYLQKGQGLNVTISINGEAINVGRFYFSSSKSEDKTLTATITAYDRFYILDTTECNIGANGTWTVSDAVNAVISDSGISINTEIPSAIATRVIGKNIPQGTSHREALRLIAQAAKCVCFFNRQDTLQFVEPSDETSSLTLDADKVYEYPNVEDTALINSVQISVRNEYVDNAEEVVYSANDIAEDEEENLLKVTNPLVQGQDVAQWILKMQKFRIKYPIEERGNPALDLQDCITPADVFGENRKAIVVSQTLTYSTGLKGTLEAVANGQSNN